MNQATPDRMGSLPTAPSLDNRSGVASVERAVLGAILLRNGAMCETLEAALRSEDFVDPKHRAIYAGMESLAQDAQPIDYVTIREVLSAAGTLAKAGGEEYVTGLAAAEDVPAAAHARAYAARVVEASRKRQLKRLGQEVVAAADNGKASARIIALATGALDMMATQGATTGRASRVGDGLRGVVDGDGQTETVSTGLRPLDNILGGGLTLGELSVIGAWPGQGKSALITQQLLAAAEKATPAALFSLEMPSRVVQARLLAFESGVPVGTIRTGRATDQQRESLERAAAVLEALPLYVRAGSLDIETLLAEARKLVAREGVRMIGVDYVQLIGSAKSERRLQVEDVIQRLLGFAVSHGVHVIAASQLRKHQAGQATVPTSHDLRESGALFEAPHVVELLWREDIDELDLTARLKITKNRSGPLGGMDLAWCGSRLRFAELERSDNYP